MRWINSCRRKHRHPSQRRAEAQIRSLSVYDPDSVGRLRAYWCLFCAFWHVGHVGGTK